jgi:hypothetical protein
MKKQLYPLLGLLGLAASQITLQGVQYGGVEFPDGAASFADAVVDYLNTGDVAYPYDNPADALGPPDWVDSDPVEPGSVSLGKDPGGYIVLQFTDNSLTTSGNSAPDLWIFEVGAVEGADIFIGKNATDWIPVGSIGGSISGVDLDAFVGAGVTLWDQYTFVKIVETDPPGAVDTGYPFAGTDIDAVGAISSAPPVNAVPEVATTVVLLALSLVSLGVLARFQPPAVMAASSRALPRT